MIGTKIAGRYEILSELGRGGMGVVYLARDPLLQRDVALKILTSNVLNPAIEERFRREARIVAQLDHFAIVPVHDTGLHYGSLFFVMPFIEGKNLRTYLEERKLRLPDYLEILAQVAEALDYSHAKGVIHRDIKPENILVYPEQENLRVKLTDFGLAITTTENRLTMNGQVAGTIAYLSPEQVTGKPMDPRADIYSLGVVLYECIAGHTPFFGEFQAVLYRIVGEEAPALRKLGHRLDSELELLILSCLQKRPEDRPQTGAGLAVQLRKCKAKITSDTMIVAPVQPDLLFLSPSKSGEGTPNNLPAGLTQLIGRDTEIQSIEMLLERENVRLLTLTGPGGTGKTHLALTIAERQMRLFQHGVFFVPLATVTDPSLVPSAIAQNLGIKGTGGSSVLESLKDLLRNRRVLLVIDNYEQVIPSAPFLSELLNAAADTKILVTSREALRIHGEQEFIVPPLPLPDLQHLPSVELLRQYSSVALFVQRASAVKSDFHLTPQNANAVAEICARLDGLPLAIELAAARVKVLPPQALLSRLEKRLKLLTGGAADRPARQQTMRGAIEWGYNLLNEEEKALFRRLCIFVGGFSLEAAEAVCAELQDLQFEILDGLTSLVDKSFIRQEGDQEARFSILETIREFGLECLIAGGEQPGMQQRHAKYFMQLAEETEPKLAQAGQEYWLERLEKEHDNIRSALDWSMRNGHVEIALRMAGALWWFWYLHGYYSEGRTWLDQVLTVSGSAPERYRMRAMLGAGVVAFLQCNYTRAGTLLNDSAALARQLKDSRTLAWSLQYLGSISREQGNYEIAISLAQVTLPLWRELEDQRGVARALNYIGFASWLEGNFEQTKKMCEESLAIFRTLGDKEGIAWALLNFGIVSHYQGNQQDATQFCKECMLLSREVGYKEGIAWAFNILGNIAEQLRQFERARTQLQKSLELHWKLGDKWRTASVLEALSRIEFAQSKPEKAVQLAAAADALRNHSGTPIPPVEKRVHDPILAAIRTSMETGLFIQHWEKGQQLPLEQIIAVALTP